MSDHSLPEELEREMERMERTETGRKMTALLRDLLRQGRAEIELVHVGELGKAEGDHPLANSDGLTATQYRNAKSASGPEATHTKVSIKLSASPNQLFCTLVHEARHCWQDWQDPYPIGTSPDGIVMRGFAQEADASAFECRVAYELALAGDSGPLTHLKSDLKFRDIAETFSEASPQGMEAATKAAHYQWEKSPARREEYRAQFIEEARYLQGQSVRKHQAADLKAETAQKLEQKLATITLPTTRNEPEQSATQTSGLTPKRRR